MHTIYDCVTSFCTLIDTEYHLVLGRKGTAVELTIRFGKKDCFHLMGLQYLTDMPNLSRDRGKIFDEINVFLFLVKDKKAEYYFCCSFFPEGKRDYTKNQASWTLLFSRSNEPNANKFAFGDCREGQIPRPLGRTC